jgi:hypothetical protein
VKHSSHAGAIAPAQQQGTSLLAVVGALFLALLLAALDQTIVSTALPTIVGELGGLTHLSWVVTAYLLTSTIAGPFYGKFGDIHGRKIVLQAAIVLFLLGSALCGLAQNMVQLIAFRALQGIGGGGLIVTAVAVVGDLIPPRERGRYQGFFGAAFGLATGGTRAHRDGAGRAGKPLAGLRRLRATRRDRPSIDGALDAGTPARNVPVGAMSACAYAMAIPAIKNPADPIAVLRKAATYTPGTRRRTRTRSPMAGCLSSKRRVTGAARAHQWSSRSNALASVGVAGRRPYLAHVSRAICTSSALLQARRSLVMRILSSRPVRTPSPFLSRTHEITSVW